MSAQVPIPFLWILDFGFEGELIWAGMDWRGPNISSGLVNRHLTLIIGGWVVGGL